MHAWPVEVAMSANLCGLLGISRSNVELSEHTSTGTPSDAPKSTTAPEAESTYTRVTSSHHASTYVLMKAEIAPTNMLSNG